MEIGELIVALMVIVIVLCSSVVILVVLHARAEHTRAKARHLLIDLLSAASRHEEPHPTFLRSFTNGDKQTWRR